MAPPDPAKFAEAQAAFAGQGDVKNAAESANNRGVCWRQAARWDEALALGSAHWDEAGLPGFGFKLNRGLYERIEENDALRLFGARNTKGRLLGYGSFFLSSHPHTEVLVASQDALYLKFGARQGWTALSFLMFIDDQLEADGVGLILQHAVPSTALAKLLKRRKYHLHAELYAKGVDHG